MILHKSVLLKSELKNDKLIIRILWFTSQLCEHGEECMALRHNERSKKWVFKCSMTAVSLFFINRTRISV